MNDPKHNHGKNYGYILETITSVFTAPKPKAGTPIK